MGSNARKQGVFDWGIVGVNLGDIEIPLNNPDDTRGQSRQYVRPLEMSSESDFSSFYLRPVDPSNESPSIFDRFPEAFVYEEPDNLESHHTHRASDSVSVYCQTLDPLVVEQDRLPYSWMVQNPGQIAKNLCSNFPPPAYIKSKPGNKSPSNDDGETRMEAEFKRGTLNPYDYFCRATAFTCIMDLNSQGLIHPNLLAAIIGRLFNGEARFLDLFNRFFMPAGFRIVPTTRRGLIHECFLQISRQLQANPIHACDPRFITLTKVVRHLAFRRFQNGIHMDETVGKLVCSSTGLEFKPSPGGQKMLHRPKLSPRFLSRLGEWWPFKNFPWQEADQLGLYGTPKANKGKSNGTVDPRLLVVRGLQRAWA